MRLIKFLLILVFSVILYFYAKGSLVDSMIYLMAFSAFVINTINYFIGKEMYLGNAPNAGVDKPIARKFLLFCSLLAGLFSLTAFYE